MKISKLFHWLYATLMFLPILVAPIFAIYTRNENSTISETIAVEENKVVDFNQLLIDSFETLDINGVTISRYSPYSIVVDGTATADIGSYQTGVNITTNPIAYRRDGSKYYLRTDNDSSLQFGISGYNIAYNNSFIFSRNNASDWSGNLAIYIRSGSSFSNYVITFNVFDLSQMFGYGNEPSAEEFNTWYNKDYYSYTLSRVELLKGYDTIIYSNTDIGSQFIYSLYITTDKYLNFDKVLNLGAISDWIELNVFNGNAPLVFYIVWHYLDYWLVLSIFWLCFDVLIYVPNIAHRWLDKASLE